MALDHRADGGRTVVVGVDGSDSSWHAAAYAVGLARRQEALLVVVHVLPQHTSAMLGGVAWMLNGTDTSEADRLRRRVCRGTGLLDRSAVAALGVPHRAAVGTWSPG